MRLVILTAMMFIAGPLPAAARQTADETPIVQIGLYGYRADGTPSSSAYETEPSLASLVHLNVSGPEQCSMGAGNRSSPPALATDAWRFSGKVVSRTTDQVVIQLDWQRVLADGTPAASPGGSQQLTLRNGDRVLLDSVTPANTRCWTSVGFEARFMPSPFDAMMAKLAMARSQKGARGGGVGVSGGAASVSGSERTSQEPSGGGGGGRWLHGTAAGGHRWLPVGVNFDVELWLVRSVTGKQDEVWHQTLRTGRDETAFAFSPIAAETARGPVVMQVTGSVAVNGQELQFETKRRATYPSAGSTTRDGAQEVQGGSRTTIPLPGPEEVVSFQLPPLPARSDRPAVADQLSVRLRITPR